MFQRHTALRGGLRGSIKLQPEAVGEARQVIEDADNMRDFETCLIVKSQVSKRLPIFLDHAGGGSTELLGDCAQGAITRGEFRYISPTFVLDRLD